PVRWVESMHYLLRHGVDDVEQVGPGDVLLKLWNAAGSASPATTPSNGHAASSGVADVLPPRANPAGIRAEHLGSREFCDDYGLGYAYLTGSMFKGIASTDLVIRMARAGLMGFFGTGGLDVPRIDATIDELQQALGPNGRFGMNLLYGLEDADLER